MILEKIETLMGEVAKLTAKNAAETDELYVKYLSKKGAEIEDSVLDSVIDESHSELDK